MQDRTDRWSRGDKLPMQLIRTTAQQSQVPRWNSLPSDPFPTNREVVVLTLDGVASALTQRLCSLRGRSLPAAALLNTEWLPPHCSISEHLWSLIIFP